MTSPELTSSDITTSDSHGQHSNWPAPAKLNLFLHITGRRKDGYHLLQTVFQLLDYGDELAFEPRTDQRITLHVNPANELLTGSDNLVLRAANALVAAATADGQREKIGGVTITLEKKLPLGGGLGGGSSDAATTLVALNHLWQLGYPLDKLMQLGLTLGADVPVFVRGCSAWAEGVGEKLQPLTLKPSWYVVIHPGIHVATSALFNHSQLTRDCSPITIRGFRSGEHTSNVFEPLVCQHHSEVQQAIDLLTVAAQNTGTATGNPRMTGTGSCVFLRCEEKSGAQKVLSAVITTEKKFSGFIAKGIDQSSLVHYL